MAQLQRVTLDCIDTVRVLLDVAEEAVRQPGGLAAIVAGTVGAFAAALGGMAPGEQSGPRGASRRADEPSAPGGSGDAPVTGSGTGSGGASGGDRSAGGVDESLLSRPAGGGTGAGTAGRRGSRRGVQHIPIS